MSEFVARAEAGSKKIPFEYTGSVAAQGWREIFHASRQLKIGRGEGSTKRTVEVCFWVLGQRTRYDTLSELLVANPLLLQLAEATYGEY